MRSARVLDHGSRSAGARLAGSIYDGFSPRGQRALGDLRQEFQVAGFYAEKERRTERTLRVYPEHRWRYPLLNPGLSSSRRTSPVPITGPSVICPVYSDGDMLIQRLLDGTPPINGSQYRPAPPRRGRRYFLHGYFIFPIALRGSPSEQVIDFAPLRPVLTNLQLHLSRSGVSGEWPEVASLR